MLEKLHLIRHGLTEGLVKRWYYGSLDLPVLDEGLEELSRLKNAGIYPDISGCRVFTTGMLRTEQTLAAIYGDIPHGVVRELREVSFGDFEGYTHEQLLEVPEYKRWLDNWTPATRYPNGESFESFRTRIVGAYKEFMSGLETDAALVCHGGTMSTMMMYLFPNERENVYQWVVQPGHGFTVSYADKKPVSHVEF